MACQKMKKNIVYINQRETPYWKNRDAAASKYDGVSQPVKRVMRRLNAPRIHDGKVKSTQKQMHQRTNNPLVALHNNKKYKNAKFNLKYLKIIIRISIILFASVFFSYPSQSSWFNSIQMISKLNMGRCVERERLIEYKISWRKRNMLIEKNTAARKD